MSLPDKYHHEAPDWVVPGDRLSFCESFSAWLDANNDSLPDPESFSEWLDQNNDSIERQDAHKPTQKQ